MAESAMHQALAVNDQHLIIKLSEVIRCRVTDKVCIGKGGFLSRFATALNSGTVSLYWHPLANE